MNLRLLALRQHIDSNQETHLFYMCESFLGKFAYMTCTSCRKYYRRNQDGSTRAHSCAGPPPNASSAQNPLDAAAEAQPATQSGDSVKSHLTDSLKRYSQLQNHARDATYFASVGDIVIELIEAGNSREGITFTATSTEARFANLLRAGEATKACGALTDTAKVDPTEENVHELFPLRGLFVSQPMETPPTEAFRPQEIKKFLRSRDNQNSKGLGGVKVKAIRQLLDEAPDMGVLLAKLLHEIYTSTQFIGSVAHHRLVALLAILLDKEKDANLRGLRASTTGRPIGVAEILLRIIEGIVTKRHLHRAASKLRQGNLTFAPAGCQVTGVLAQERYNSGSTTLCKDMRNAFGNCNVELAKTALQQVDEPHLAYLLNFVGQREYVFSHADGTSVRVSSHCLTQGSSPSSLAMSLVTDTITKPVKEAFPAIHISSIVDDITVFAASALDIPAIDEALGVSGASKGATFNPTKTKCTKKDATEEERQLLSGFGFCEGLKLVGVAVGSDEAIQQITNQTLLEFHEEFDAFCATFEQETGDEEDKPTRQTFTKALGQNFLPKLEWIAQTTPAPFCEDGLRAAHGKIVQAFLKANHINPQSISQLSQERICLQLGLPKREAGFGLTNIVPRLDAIRLGVLLQALPYALNEFQCSPALPELMLVCDRLIQTPGITDTTLLSHLNQIKDINSRDRTIDIMPDIYLSVPKRFKALLFQIQKTTWKSKCHLESNITAEIVRSIESPEAGLPLSVDPRNHPMSDTVWVLYCKQRLIFPIVGLDVKCSRCEQVVDSNLQHPMRCVKVGRNTVHYPISKFISGHLTQVLRHTTSSVHYEMSMAHMTTPACTKFNPQVDLVIRNPVTGKNYMVDFTFPIINDQATSLNSSVMIAETRKEGWYDHNIDYKHEYELIPGPIDTYGRMGGKLKDFLKKMAKQATDTTTGYNYEVFKIRAAIAVMHRKVIAQQQATFLRENRV
jgi:hypothetical protein